MAYGYIYKITNMINGKVYIGQAIDVMTRWKSHIRKSKTATDGVDYAIRKYGAGCFTVITICECYDHKDLDDAEKYFIALYRKIYTRKYCYNKADGGQGGNLGEEVNKKISKANKGKHHTEAAKKKISDATKGEKNPMYGRTGDKNPNWGRTGDKHPNWGKPAPNRHKINQYDLEGNFIREWESITQAAKELNIYCSSISECCKGKRNKAGGFIWRLKI